MHTQDVFKTIAAAISQGNPYAIADLRIANDKSVQPDWQRDYIDEGLAAIQDAITVARYEGAA